LSTGGIGGIRTFFNNLFIATLRLFGYNCLRGRRGFMKGLFLCGIYCTTDIWSRMRGCFSDIDAEYAGYPHPVTETAMSVADITRWVYEEYGNTAYDFVVGHSMGGIVALELADKYGLNAGKIVLIDTNLRPASAFYRNLMTPAHMQQYGPEVLAMMQAEAPFYQESLKRSLQEDFDFSGYVMAATQKIHAIYGDRGQRGYPGRISDLCLDESIIKKLSFSFVEDACHMPMIENPRGLADAILTIVNTNPLL
jgi:pimeloyl-ACP methyl ester carboxylesterase